jgi:integrase
MPRKKKLARLWLRKTNGRNPRYVILDAGREIETGFGVDFERDAEERLSQYLAKRARPNTQQRDASKITAAEIMMLYMKDVAPMTASPALIGYHATALLKFWGRKSLSQINGTSCRDYAIDRGKAVSQSTVRRELETFQAAINHWHRESPLAAVPVITKPAKGVRRQRYLTRQEVAKMLWTARRLKHWHIARFILIGVYTGTRHEALLNLKWFPSDFAGHIDVDGSRLYRRGAAETETNKKRPTSRIPERLMRHLRRWHISDLAQGPQTAIIRWQGKPILKERRAWALVVAAAGLGNDITPHVLRHTCVTWALQNGMDLWDIAGLTGMSIKTIESTYGHQDADFQVAAKGAFMGNHGQKTGTK